MYFIVEFYSSALYKMEMPSIQTDALTKSDMHIDISSLLLFIKLYAALSFRSCFYYGC